jgi:hypothetical protein
VGPRAGLDTEARGKILCPSRGSNPDRAVVQPVVRHERNVITFLTLSIPKLIYIIFIHGDITANETRRVSMTTINLLMLLKEIIAVYSEKVTTPINTLCG